MVQTAKLEPMADWASITATASDCEELGWDAAMRMHNHLHLVRAFEEMVLEMDGHGLIHGPAHSSIGQEGGAIGSVAPLRPHRPGHRLASRASPIPRQGTRLCGRGRGDLSRRGRA